MQVFSQYFLATFSGRIGEWMLYFSLTLLLPPATIHLLFLYCSPAFAHAACASLHRGFQLLIHKPLLRGFLLPLVSSTLFPSP